MDVDRQSLVIYTIAKKNIGSPRKFKTREGLERAVREAGATEVSFSHDNLALCVCWPDGLKSYAIDNDGNLDPQLAWDLEP